MHTMVVDTDSVHCGPAHVEPPLHGAVSAGLDYASAEIRLTRRGRLVMLMAVLSPVFGMLMLLGAPAASTDQTRHPVGRSVVVEPGDTLWNIAASVAPDEDPRDVISQIVDLNSLTDEGSIRVGQPLYVPVQ